MTAPTDGVKRPATAPSKERPLYAQEPFQKQTTRKQAVQGKLLEDIAMTRFLVGNGGSADVMYDVKLEAQSHAKNVGAVRTFNSQVGRLDLHRSGTRAAADGVYPSHWYPNKPPKDDLTRPTSASSGMKFEKQITRKQDVNGKLLEDIPMTRFLFGANMTGGPEYYEKAYDSMMTPLSTSHRKRIGQGQHNFQRQVGRIPLHRQGTRASADGTFPSHWEPGMGYSATMSNAGNASGFDRMLGRVDLHLSGMRGAPAKPSLAADFNGGAQRPQSAMAALRQASQSDGFSKKTRAGHGAVPKQRPQSALIPPSMNKKIQTASMDKQLTREQWTKMTMRS